MKMIKKSFIKTLEKYRVKNITQQEKTILVPKFKIILKFLNPLKNGYSRKKK